MRRTLTVAMCICAIALSVIAAILWGHLGIPVNWDAINALGTWVGAVAAAIIGYLLWRTNDRLTWLTGSMESYAMKQLILEAKKNPNVTLRWWDPEIAPWPHSGEHNEDVKVDVIYLGIPLTHRKGTHTIK